MKRVVFLDAHGPAQILGLWDESIKALPVVTPRAFIASTGREVPFASLVKVTPRAAFYKEPILPASSSFHAAQR